MNACSSFHEMSSSLFFEISEIFKWYKSTLMQVFRISKFFRKRKYNSKLFTVHYKFEFDIMKMTFRHINSRNVYSNNLLVRMCYFSFYAFSKRAMKFWTATAFSIFISLECNFSAAETNSIFNSIINKFSFCITNSKLGAVLRDLYR